MTVNTIISIAHYQQRNLVDNCYEIENKKGLKVIFTEELECNAECFSMVECPHVTGVHAAGEESSWDHVVLKHLCSYKKKYIIAWGGIISYVV